DWDVDTANVYDGSAFQHLVDAVADSLLVLADPHFVKEGWTPPSLKICPRGDWNDRMIIETVLSMLTVVSDFKKVGHRAWNYLVSRVSYTMALFNILVQWDELSLDENGFVPLSIAQFSL
ncbi:MAG: hypothetical protein J5I90_16460, partial [Caldilineales bacterium]|nr:hypothetical protein [Caldilineales bacterium]